jgi:hypothetical protein
MECVRILDVSSFINRSIRSKKGSQNDKSTKSKKVLADRGSAYWQESAYLHCQASCGHIRLKPGGKFSHNVSAIFHFALSL